MLKLKEHVHTRAEPREWPDCYSCRSKKTVSVFVLSFLNKGKQIPMDFTPPLPRVLMCVEQLTYFFRGKKIAVVCVLNVCYTN